MEAHIKALIDRKDKKLYKLSEIEPVRTYDYSIPTLVEKDRFTDRVPWTDSAMFKSELIKKYPVLGSISLKNVAIVGGCVVDMLTKKTPSDIDMFILLDDSQKEWDEVKANSFIETRIKQLLDEIFNYIKEHNTEIERLKAERTATNEIRSRRTYDLDSFKVS